MSAKMKNKLYLIFILLLLAGILGAYAEEAAANPGVQETAAKSGILGGLFDAGKKAAMGSSDVTAKEIITTKLNEEKKIGIEAGLEKPEDLLIKNGITFDPNKKLILFEKAGSQAIIRGAKFDNIKEGGKITLDEKGRIKSADFTIENNANKGDGNRLIMKGVEFTAPVNSRIIVAEGDNKIKVNLPKNSASKIKEEPKLNNKEEKGIVQYIASEDKADGYFPNGMKFRGIVSSDGNNWFIGKDEQTIINDGVRIKNVFGTFKNLNENINIYFKDSKFDGNYVYLGEKSLKFGSKNGMDGGVIEFLDSVKNPYVNVQKGQHLAIQALRNSEIEVGNGKIIVSKGGLIEQDAHTYLFNPENGKVFMTKNAVMKGTANYGSYGETKNVPIDFIPLNEGRVPVNKFNPKIVFDDKTGFKVVSMSNEEVRLLSNQQVDGIPVIPPEKKPASSAEGNQVPALPDYNRFRGSEKTYRTKNFFVTSASGNARMYAEALEYNRLKNAIEWTGKPLADWTRPAYVRINEMNMPEGGGTTNGGWMSGGGTPYVIDIKGNPQNLLMDIIPHEVMHTVTADALKIMPAMWIMEGMATSAETDLKQAKLYGDSLRRFIQSGITPNIRKFADNKQYPVDPITNPGGVMPFYGAGNAIANYLIQQGGGGMQGKQKLMQATVYANQNGWNAALGKFYGMNINQLQSGWVNSLTKIIAIFSKILSENAHINSLRALILS